MHCGAKRRVWLCTVGQSAEFGYALWGKAQSLVMHYGPERRVWLCNVGQNTEFVMDYGPELVFDYALWARAQSLGLYYGPERRVGAMPRETTQKM
jgi:hypothetical protein